MRYLVDSDYVADWLKGRPEAVTVLSTLAPEGLAISLITYGEIYEGIFYGSNPQKHEHGFRQFLRQADVLPFTKPIMKRFAHVRGRLRQTGSIIGQADILIAATALHHNLTIVTRNVRHFARIPNLRLYQPR